MLGVEYQVTGAPRHVPLGALVRVGERRGVTLFIEDGIDLLAHPEIVYVLTRSCEFVPYRSRYWSRH